MSDKVLDEIHAYQRLQAWLLEGQSLRAAFEAAQLTVPDSLRRFSGDSDDDSKTTARRRVLPMKAPPRPAGAGPKWIWIPIADATPQTRALAILRQNHPNPMTAKAVAEEIDRISGGEKINFNSIYNIGPRMQNNGVIRRDESGWMLTDSSTAPILDNGYVWCAQEESTEQEVAAHRRMAILHLLSSSSDGLQIMQIVREMNESKLLFGDVGKETISDDIEHLQRKKKVKRAGGSRKYVIVNNRDSED